MNLQYDDEQRMLRDTAREFVARACPSTRVRAIEASIDGFDAELWQSVRRLGWPGLALPERYGGDGMGVLELVLVAEELGYGAVPTPLLSSTALVSLPIARARETEHAERWLPALADGSAIGAGLVVAPGGRDERGAPPAVADEQLRLQGRASLVPYAAQSAVFLLRLRLPDGRAALALLPADPARPLPMRRQHVLGGDPLYEVTLDDVVLDTHQLLATGDEADALLDRALDVAAITTLGYAVGAAERSLQLSLQHAGTRHQFGRPIGAFQAVAHRCVDMRSDIDACRYLTYQAAWSLEPAAVSAAKAFGNEALRRVQRNAHQVHGAIGFSLEHDLQLFTRRLKACELTFGSTAWHRERLAGEMGLTPG